MFELWARQIAAMSTTQMLTLIALVVGIVGQIIRLIGEVDNA